VTSAPAERHARKALGAFYSPPALVAPMIAWAVPSPLHAVLDPSCGDGIFIEAAARRLIRLGASPAAAARQLRALDVNPEAALATRAALRSALGPAEVDVRTESFFALDAPGPSGDAAVDAIIGNPPYIRYQAFSGAPRAQALGRARDAGVALTQLASSWAHFVVHATAFLRRGGRLALLLPAELIHASYAAPLRRHLRASFREVHVISFRTAVFPGAQEAVVVLLASGRGEPHERLGLVDLGSAGELADLEGALRRAEHFAPGVDPAKWVRGYAASPAAACLERLRAGGLYVPLARVGKASVGFVSGANEFFVLSQPEAAALALPAASLRPALIRARQLAGLWIAPGDVLALREGGERCLLWLPGPELTGPERDRVRRGEEAGVASRYKCRVRSPWWLVPGVVAPDAFLTYMSDAVPRLCLNEAGAVAANTLLTVRLPGVPPPLRRAFATAFHGSATLLSCERTGRSYGGGVLKLEPSEADRILVPSPELVAARVEALCALSDRLREGLAAGGDRLARALRAVDAVVLEAAGARPDEIEQLAAARAEAAARRRERARPGRAGAIEPVRVE
jgi:tRNA1(Val) A37 N6-methylase TrmN6